MTASLPHDLDAEQAVLGAVLFDNNIFERLKLRAAHFYVPAHQRIWEAMRTLVEAGKIADGLTLRKHFEADGALKEIGGASYLMTLLERAAKLTIHALDYAELIIDTYARREATRALEQARALVLANEDVFAAVAEAETSLRALGEADATIGADLAECNVALLHDLDTPMMACGLSALDHRLGGLERGGLYIIAGRPSMGKTTLACQIARNVARQGRSVHFASLEMSRTAIACRSLSAMSFNRRSEMERLEYFHIRRGTNADRDLLRSLAKELPRYMLVDDRAAQTLGQLEGSARATRRRLGRLDLIVVDYLQLMRASHRGENRVLEIGEITQGLKALAKRLDVPVVALSQLSRAVESRENKRPMLSDLRESGSIEQDADAVLAVYRERYYLERAEPPAQPQHAWHEWRKKMDEFALQLEVITLKQRQGPIGTDLLEAHLAFDTVRDWRGAA